MPSSNTSTKKKPTATTDNKEITVKTPVKSAKPTATSTPKSAPTPSKSAATPDSKSVKQEEPKTPASSVKKSATKPTPKLVPLPDSDSDDIGKCYSS